MDDDPAKAKIDKYNDRPNYTEYNDHPLDRTLYLDPVLRRLAGQDEGLGNKLRAIDGIKALEVALPLVETALHHELQVAAENSFYFPYSENSTMQEAAGQSSALRLALDEFTASRSSWKQDPENPVTIATYLAAADVVEEEQDAQGLFLTDEL